DRASIKDLILLHDSHDSAGQIILSHCVEIGDLRRLAANKSGAVVLAGCGESANDVLHHPWVDLTGGEVIQEVERLSAAHRTVVDAVIDEVTADRLVAPHTKRYLHLGPDPING